MESQEERGKRLARLLPVLVISSIMGILYAVYMLYHCIPLLQFEIPAEYRDRGGIARGGAHLIFVHASSAMVLWAFYMAFKTDPGRVPQSSDWERKPDPKLINERKHDGGLRYCHKCSRFKPDRCHHSSSSGRCVLKMDHYCPWVANDIGFFNYKFFFLTLFYGSITLFFLCVTMFPTVRSSFEDPNVPFEQVFFIFLGALLSAFLFSIVGPFCAFHTWLISKNATTIEYCEKRRMVMDSPYDMGTIENFKSVLGDQILLWLIPVGAPAGDGITFQRRG